MSERVLIDTGPMVALFSREDANHGRCVAAAGLLPAPFLTCWPVITEAVYFLRKRPDAITRILEGFAGGLFSLLALDSEDLPTIAEIMTRYQSLGLQLADASLIHLAEREGIQTVFTLDRRDFSVVRLKRTQQFKLIP